MTDGVAAVATALARHEPRDAQEVRSVSRGLALLTWLRAPLDERADPAHVTGSAVVLDTRGRVLLHRHKRLGTWLQPGGHLDPGESPAEAAVRETLEETGVEARHPGPRPTLAHVDLHEGPRGHLHIDLRYLLLAGPDSPLAPAPGESPEVAWTTVDEVRRRCDRSLVSAVNAALALTTRPDGPR